MVDVTAPPTDRGLVWGYVLDRQGGGRRVGWPEIEQWQPAEGLLWVHFDISEPGADAWIEERSGLEAPIAAALLAEDTRPRSAPSMHYLIHHP